MVKLINVSTFELKAISKGIQKVVFIGDRPLYDRTPETFDQPK